MRHLSKRLVALALSITLAATMTPATANAAAKKTVTVSTQSELTKALAKKGLSKIIVKTKKAVKFTVKKGTYSAKLEMNAPKATINNSGKWREVTVLDAKTYTEKAKNNKIVVKDKKLTFTVAKGATVKALTFAKKGASNTVKIDGLVSAITISAPSTNKITDNGNLKKVSVDAKATVNLSGTSNKKVAVTLTKKAAGSSVKSAVPVSVNTSAIVSIILQKGAEGSSVALKNVNANVDLTNNSKVAIVVTKADGTKESVAAGDKFSTVGDSSEKEDEKKEDEKKPTFGGGGGGTSGGGSGVEEDKTPSLTLDKSEVTLSKWDNGGKLTLQATKKNIAGAVEWSSSTPSAITVENGELTYIATGTSVITASAGGIQATCVVTTTDKVISASGFEAAVAGTDAGGTVTLGSDIIGNVIATVNGVITINMENYKLNGSLTLKEKDGLTSDYSVILNDNGEEIIGATITGDFTVHLPHAHVENNVCVQGNTNIVEVSDSTYQVKDRENRVLLKGPGKLDIKADKRIAPQVIVDTDKKITLAGNVKDVSVEKPAEITVDATASVEKIEVKNSAAMGANTVTVKGDGKVTALEAKAPVEVSVATTELTASAPVAVSGTAISNIYVESNTAKITLESTATVESLSVSNEKVNTISILGSGTVKTVDVTNVAESITVAVAQAVAEKVKDVVATGSEKIKTESQKLTGKVKIPYSLRVLTSPLKTEFFVGETPVITGASIEIVYSDNSTSSAISVSDKMLDLSDVKKDAEGEYPVKLSYASLKLDDFISLKYNKDTVKEKQYANNSMKKTVYTREDMLDPAGAVVTLNYVSGKKEQVLAGDTRLSFWNGTTDLTKTPLLTKSNKYEVEIKFENETVGTQYITVNPKKYTVKLNANEYVGAQGRVEVIIGVEEFTTLNQLKDAGKLKMPATPSAIDYANRFWEFVKWTEAGDRQEKTYSWDTPIEGNLDLIGRWDTVKSIEYVPNSLDKRVYTRGESFAASGASIRLTLNSGKTKDITREGQLKFTDNEGKEISTVSPARKGDYVINVMFDGKKVGSQTVTVKPIMHTVTIDPNENGPDTGKVTVQVEEFTSLNDLKATGALKISETPTASSPEHSTWDFLKWVKAEDETKTAYSWDTPVESDLNLIGCWDTIQDANYVANSMNKLVYTRTDKFDPTGAKIRLTYASGKMKEITDTSKMSFTDQNGMKLENTSWQNKGEHVINIYYDKYSAGSQKVTVNPIYYTITLDPKEGGRKKETATAEEFETLNDLCSRGAITLTAELKPKAEEHRAWKFLGWGSDGDVNTNDYYSWDDPIKSDLNLKAEWSENGLKQDAVTLTVLGNPVKADRSYRVQVSHVDHFLHCVSAGSLYAENVSVKYAIAGTDVWTDYSPATTTAGAISLKENTKYEIVYYTDNGATYNGAQTSLFIETKSEYIDFDTDAKGIIWLNNARAEVAYQPLDYPIVSINLLDVPQDSIKVTPTNASDTSAYGASCVPRSNRSVLEFNVNKYHGANSSDIEHEKEVKVPRGEYQIDFRYLLNPTYNEQGVLQEEPINTSVTVNFDCAFDNKVNASCNAHSDGNGEPVAQTLIKYSDSAKTVADYINAVIPKDATMSYTVGLATESSIYTQISDLSEIKVTGEAVYTLIVNSGKISGRYILDFYQGPRIVNAFAVNRNCVMVQLPEHPASDFRFDVLSASESLIGVQHVICNGPEALLLLNQPMKSGENYTVRMTMDGKTVYYPFINSFYSGKNAVCGAEIVSGQSIVIQMNNTIEENVLKYDQLRFIVMEDTGNGTTDLHIESVSLSGQNQNQVIVTTTEPLSDKSIILTVYGPWYLDSVFERVFKSESTELTEITESNIEDFVSNNITKAGNFYLNTDYVAPNGLIVSSGTSIYIAPGKRFIVNEGVTITNMGLISNECGTIQKASQAATFALRAVSLADDGSSDVTGKAGCLDIAAGGSIKAFANSAMIFSSKDDLMSRAENGLLLYSGTRLVINGKPYIGPGSMVELENYTGSAKPIAGWYINGDGWLCLVVGEKAIITNRCGQGELDLHVIVKNAGLDNQSEPGMLFVNDLKQMMAQTSSDDKGESGGTIAIEQHASLYVNNQPYVLPATQESENTFVIENDAVMYFVTNSALKAPQDNSGAAIDAESNRYVTCFSRSGDNIVFYSDFGHLYINKIDSILKMGKVHNITYSSDAVKQYYDNNQMSGGGSDDSGYSIVLNSDKLMILGVQFETNESNAFRFQVADACSGSSVKYMLDVQEMVQEGMPKSYTSSFVTDISNGLVVNNLPADLVNGKAYYTVKLLCWRDDTKQKEFSNIYYIHIENGVIQMTSSWQEKTGVSSLCVKSAAICSDSAIKISFSDDNNPNNEASNSYGVIVHKFDKEGNYIGELGRVSCNSTGDIIVDNLSMKDIIADTGSSYRVLVMCTKAKQPVTEFSQYYILTFGTDNTISVSALS